MAETTAVGQLVEIIDRLKQLRADCAAKFAEMDTLFDELGVPLGGQTPASAKGRPGRKPGRPAGSTAASATRKGKRKQFKTTAADSVLGFIKSRGSKGATSAEIGKHWKAEGRAAQPFITLGQLVKARKLKKQQIKDGRGSRYTVG